MRFLISEKLGPHKYKTPEGYLVCVDAILSRTGTQEYRRCELFGDACDDPDKTITVDRKADEVFSDKAMASFENKAICIEHPNTNVDVENHNDLSVGFVRDIHRGEDNDTPVMMGTLVITDKDAVEAIESGEYKELSCGYDCDIEDEHSPQQRNIRGNHVALCKQGRAGIARIVDSKVNDDLIREVDIKHVVGLKSPSGAKSYLVKHYESFPISFLSTSYIGAKDVAYFDTVSEVQKVVANVKRVMEKDERLLGYTFFFPRVKIDKKTGKYINTYYAGDSNIKNYEAIAGIVDSQMSDISNSDFEMILDIFDLKNIDYSGADYESKNVWFENDRAYSAAVKELRNRRYKFEERVNRRGKKLIRIIDKVFDSVNDDVTITDSKIWNPDFYLKKEPNYEKAHDDIRIMMKNANVKPYDINISVYGSCIKFNPGDVKFDALQLKQILTQVLQQINRSLSVSSIRSRGGIVTFEIAGYQYLQEKYKVFDAIKDAYTDFEVGYRDGKLGMYDKWYRYNRKDEGKEYDIGIQKAKREGYEIKNFIKGTGDSMKDSLTDDAVIYDEWQENGKWYRVAYYTIIGYSTNNYELYVRARDNADAKTKAVKAAKSINRDSKICGKNFMHVTEVSEQEVKRQHPSIVFDSITEDATLPKIRALGKWEWDEVRCDWYDTGRKMYLIEIERNSTQDASQNYTFKLAKRKNDYDEFVIKAYKNGKYNEGATYYTDDWEDAVGTLKAMSKQYGLSVKQNGSSYTADALTNDAYMEVATTTPDDDIYYAKKHMLTGKVVGHSGQDTLIRFEGTRENLKKFKNAGFFMYDPDAIIKDSTKDSVYTVEYVKDNITHIVEVEAKTIVDAVIKAKNFV